ncbi:MAG TPA: hypothetical protein VHO03_17325 [Ignavibacteriales bacterium]|nr:hypothetical protein [Ignavibacteriales bacterium]
MKLTEILALIFIVAASAAAGHFLWPAKRNPGNKEALKADTVVVYNTRTDTLPGKETFVPVKEKVNIDSLWQEAKEYALKMIYGNKKKDNPDTLNNFNYIMISDTTFQDSTLSERIRFISPIPVHPRSYFTREVTWKERLVFQPVVKEESFWNRFSWGLQAGFGYGIIHRQLDFYVGAGGSFKIK